MPKTISEIYDEYDLMPILREHMLRVAAVAYLICDNFNEPLPKDKIITACLLHDMGNIIKFDLTCFPEFNEPKGIEYWKKVRDEYVKKYGPDEHEATIKILKELGISSDVILFVDEIQFSLLCKHRDSNDMNIKITHYVDNRVSPHGVVSYDERINEAKERYKNREHFFSSVGREEFIACGREIEKQIFAKCRIKPADINNETVAPVILKLRDFVIK